MAAASASENQVIAIRALGRDGDESTHYVATEDSLSKANIFSFRVQETENFIEIYEDVNVQFGKDGSAWKYKATGGLRQSYEPMVVSLRNGEKLFTVGIQKVELESAYFINYQQMVYDYYYIAEEKEHEVKVRFITDSSKHVGALIRARKQFSSVIVTIYGELPMIEILALTMAGFKHFYCFFKLHLHSMPAHIPCLITRQQWRIQIFDQGLKTINHMILRPSCEDRTGAKYMELLHGQSKKVVMVIAYFGSLLDYATIHFRTPDDRLVFKTKDTEDQSGNVSTDVMIRTVKEGSVENGKFFINIQRMYEKPRDNPPLITEIYEMRRITPSATISEGEDKSSIILKALEFSETADTLIHRYLVLAHAANIAIRHYKLLDCCLPFFDRYPYCTNNFDG